MARVKIKQLGDVVATAGLHFGAGPQARKLEPGEVVEIPDDLLLPDGRKLIDVLWNTGKLELTLDAVTRPINYKDYREATLCGPNFKPRDTSEEREMQVARDRVRLRIQESEAVAEEKPDTAGLDATPARKPITRKGPPRKRRRPNVARAAHGTENTT